MNPGGVLLLGECETCLLVRQGNEKQDAGQVEDDFLLKVLVRGLENHCPAAAFAETEDIGPAQLDDPEVLASPESREELLDCVMEFMARVGIGDLGGGLHDGTEDESVGARDSQMFGEFALPDVIYLCDLRLDLREKGGAEVGREKEVCGECQGFVGADDVWNGNRDKDGGDHRFEGGTLVEIIRAEVVVKDDEVLNPVDVPVELLRDNGFGITEGGHRLPRVLVEGVADDGDDVHTIVGLDAGDDGHP